MSGAYVAKPAVVSVPDLPPGWNPNWPFPGASPPGYEGITPELRLTAGAIYVPETEHGATARIVDVKLGVDYQTRKPDSGSQVTWSATMDGGPLLLLGEGEQVGIEIFYSYDDEAVDSFWVQTPVFAFPTVGEGDDGKIITLEAATIEPFGEEPWDGFRTWVITTITVQTCEVDLEEQHSTVTFEWLWDLCVDYTTAGMRVIAEHKDSAGEGGWSEYVNTKVAESCNVPRFWIWTRYPEMGGWWGNTVGIIDKNGIAQAPFAYHSGGTWGEGSGSGSSTDSWWLIQLVPEDREDGEELETTKPLTGTIHWMAWESTWSWNCSCVYHEVEFPGVDYRAFTYTTTTWDSCTDETVVTVSEFEVPIGHIIVNSRCRDLGDCSESNSDSGEDSGEAGETSVSQGEDFFKTWDYYVGELE